MYRDDETAQAVAAERTRIQSILELPEAKSRPTSARSFAFTAGMGLDAARTALAALPPEASGLSADHQTIQQRADTGREFGNNGPAQASPEAAKAGWGKAIASANRSVPTITV